MKHLPCNEVLIVLFMFIFSSRKTGLFRLASRFTACLLSARCSFTTRLVTWLAFMWRFILWPVILKPVVTWRCFCCHGNLTINRWEWTWIIVLSVDLSCKDWRDVTFQIYYRCQIILNWRWIKNIIKTVRNCFEMIRQKSCFQNIKLFRNMAHVWIWWY